jgi:hypothetical protein
MRLLFHWWQISAVAMSSLCRQSNRLTQGWVRVNGFTDINSISAHLNCKTDFAN